MALGGKYAFATVMSLVLPMCILSSCSSVLMALGMFMKVMSSLISVMSPPPSLFLISVCAYGGVVWYFRCFIFLCEFCFLYCADVRLGAVYEFF